MSSRSGYATAGIVLAVVGILAQIVGCSLFGVPLPNSVPSWVPYFMISIGIFVMFFAMWLLPYVVSSRLVDVV